MGKNLKILYFDHKLIKSMKYILYKILNTFLISFIKVVSYSEIVHAKKKLSYVKGKKFFFDFTHSTTHMGDRLFFFRLIRYLEVNNFEVFISDSDYSTLELYSTIFDIHSVKLSSKNNKYDYYVIPSPTLNIKNIRFLLSLNLIVCKFTDVKSESILDQLDYGFGKILNLNINSRKCLQNVDKNMNDGVDVADKYNLSVNQRYYLYSNYIDSGRFRKFFVKEGMLSNKAMDLKNKGFKIIHIGTNLDRVNDSKKYSFIDVDLRGKLRLTDLVILIKSNIVSGAISFDNLIMHISGIYNKDCHILFRGRFLKKNSMQHYKFINQVFFNNNNINYLRDIK